MRRSQPSPQGAGILAWLYTDKAGLYSVPLGDLAAQTGIAIAQLRTAARTGLLGFSNEGQAVAWYFDAPKDRLLFTGAAYETFLTQGNAYLFQGTARRDPQQMTVRDGKAPAAGLQTPFREVLHFEEEGDMMFATWLDPEHPDARYWFWDYLMGSSKPEIQVPLRVPNPATGGDGTVAGGAAWFHRHLSWR